ncbi:hypothetical protein HPP92_007289 [Vanilla planifolia]|uniref:Uncharacterized protein n=1 Tax=Vanilla planifolia TaxID=51239 RepID=A0A835RK54_VANPL|nr:hypothetical protein HPP92_007289 [Vanilla planifolia]
MGRRRGTYKADVSDPPREMETREVDRHCEEEAVNPRGGLNNIMERKGVAHGEQGVEGHGRWCCAFMDTHQMFQLLRQRGLVVVKMPRPYYLSLRATNVYVILLASIFGDNFGGYFGNEFASIPILL